MMDEQTVPGALDDIKARLVRGDERMRNIEMRQTDTGEALMRISAQLGAMDAKIDNNTRELRSNSETTSVVKDAITTARMGRSFFLWVGGMVGAITTICASAYAAYKAWPH